MASRTRKAEDTLEEEVVTTVLPPIITTTYNSPLVYPIYSEERQDDKAQSKSDVRVHGPSPSSRLEYHPFQRKRKAFQTKEIIQRVPVERTIIDYEPIKRINYVPRERVITDYYVIEHQTAYIPRNIQEKVIEYVPVERYSERIQYKPVEKQILHYPKDFDPVNLVGLSNISQTVPMGTSQAKKSGMFVQSNIKENTVVGAGLKEGTVTKQIQHSEIQEAADQEKLTQLKVREPKEQEEIPQRDKASAKAYKQIKKTIPLKQVLEASNQNNFNAENARTQSQNKGSLKYNLGSLPSSGGNFQGNREPQGQMEGPFMPGAHGYYAPQYYPQMGVAPMFMQGNSHLPQNIPANFNMVRPTPPFNGIPYRGQSTPFVSNQFVAQGPYATDNFSRAYHGGSNIHPGGSYQFLNQLPLGPHMDTFFPPQLHSQLQPQGAPPAQQFGIVPNYNVMGQRNLPNTYGAQMTDSYQYPMRNVQGSQNINGPFQGRQSNSKEESSSYSGSDNDGSDGEDQMIDSQESVEVSNVSDDEVAVNLRN